jgi:hypothetical protein
MKVSQLLRNMKVNYCKSLLYILLHTCHILFQLTLILRIFSFPFFFHPCILGTESIDPSFNVWNQFLNDVTQPALRLDGSLTATHKLHQEIKDVTTPGSIEELFDIIDYNKGGAVVRMIALALDRQYGSKTW